MSFRMDQLLFSFSAGLDAVEGELLGATTNHGKRLAVLTGAMGRACGWREAQIVDIMASALLHDNALTESVQGEGDGPQHDVYLKAHCIKGEKNASYLPFQTDVKGFILYHHERMDGSGPFAMDAEETPKGAQFIAIVDDLDTHHGLHTLSAAMLEDFRRDILVKRGSFYTPDAVDSLLPVLSAEMLASLRDTRISETFERAMPPWVVDIHAKEMMEVAAAFARITDYKSHFTAKHSIQIANRAYWMARFYQYDQETCARIYLAAALHDIGKLLTPTAILEKPGKLSDEEYTIIKDHVYWSYMLLKDVEGFEEICRWAVTHHRKLDGTGYPALPEEYLALDFVSRMMGCIDVYQAVRETRPYHAGRTHQETMHIMWGMVNRGEIDRKITQDLDDEMARFPTGDGDVPGPERQTAQLPPIG